eukprot:Skav200154  [mRNA]  locus=scaffold4148:2842:4584:- [translate_table: standard]
MAPKRDLYKTLGILRTSTDGEIRAAFKRRALETHPDKGGDHDSFLKVIGAFTALSDPIERASYDAQLVQRNDSDGISLPPSKAHPVTKVKRKVEEPTQLPNERPNERPKERPKKRPNERPNDQPGSKRQRPDPPPEAKAAGPTTADAADEADVAWQGLLTAKESEEQLEESWFRKFSWRFMTRILEAGRCSISAERSQKVFAHERHGPKGTKGPKGPKAPRAKLRLKRIADIPAARRPGNVPKLQRHIYSVGKHRDRFCCRMLFNFLDVRSRNTSSLEEAIDWHICLTRFRHVALRIFEEPPKEGPDDSHSRILAALDSSFKDHLEQGGSRPNLTFNLILCVRTPEHEINRRGSHIKQSLFSTPDLEWVLQAHARIRRVLRECDRNSAHEIMNQLRQESLSMSKERRSLAKHEIRAARAQRIKDRKAQQAEKKAQEKAQKREAQKVQKVKDQAAKREARAQRREKRQRARRLLQRLTRWRRTFKLPNGLPEGIDAAWVDFGLGKEVCYFAELNNECTGPMRSSSKEASEDFMSLQKIHRLNGPEVALEAATKLETEAMVHRFRKQASLGAQNGRNDAGRI